MSLPTVPRWIPGYLISEEVDLSSVVEPDSMLTTELKREFLPLPDINPAREEIRINALRFS